jgi:hypothetical protein
MHTCWLLLWMSLDLFFYVSLLILKGIGKRKKSKGGIEGGVPRPVGGRGVLHATYHQKWHDMC